MEVVSVLLSESVLCSDADMQAVYMKSVKSPVDVPGREGQGRYRLQFNLADVTDVISQSSDNDRSHDESHYMIDSFCVSTDHGVLFLFILSTYIYLCIYKTLNETAKGNFENTLIQ